MYIGGRSGMQGQGCWGSGRGHSCRVDRASFGGHRREFSGHCGGDRAFDRGFSADNFGRGLNKQPYEFGDHFHGCGRRFGGDPGVFHRGFGVGPHGFGGGLRGHHHHRCSRFGGHPHGFGGHPHGFGGHPHGLGGHPHGLGGHPHGLGGHPHGFKGLRGNLHGFGGHRGGFRGNFWGNCEGFGDEAAFCNHGESDEN